MKKLICFLVLILITTTQSQSIMRIWKGGVKLDSVAVTNDLKITFGTGSGDFNCGTSQVIYEGKTYNTVLIGSQCWLKENLNFGTRINGDQNQTNNSTTEKYCYNDQESNCNTYGGLYQWNEAMKYITTAGAKGICPTGWHIPTYAELQTLGSRVDNNGNALKAIGQGSGGGIGTNTSGFSALLAGYRPLCCLGVYAYFWSSSANEHSGAYFLGLGSDYSTIYFHTGNVEYYGFSIRCLKD